MTCKDVEISKFRTSDLADPLPYISVVIPVYNGENYLREAIASVLNQTYTNYELIVVDDGSSDNTWDIIQSYGDKIRGFHKENGGVSTALNFAIGVMRGEWFAWLSHDDLWVPEKLEKHVVWIRQHKNYMMHYGSSAIIDPSGNIISEWTSFRYSRGKDLRKMLRPGCYINGITTLINRECFQTVGVFNEKYRCVQDADMWFRIACKYEMFYLPEILAKTRRHQNQTGKLICNKCKTEILSLKLKELIETPLPLFYPALSDPDINISKYVLLLAWGKLYVVFTRFCLIYNIPTTLNIFVSILRKMPVSIRTLAYLIYCKIVQMRL